MDENNSQNYAQASQASSVNKKRFNLSKIPAVPVIGGVIVLLLIVVAAFFLSSGNRQDPRVVALMTEGDKASDSANYKKAQENYAKALEIDKNNPGIKANLINSYMMAGNQSGQEEESLTQAQPIVDSALKSNPNNLEVLLAAGYAYETAGDYKKAQTYYKKATEVDPNSSEAWFHLGHVSQFLADNEKANEYYDKAYKLDPKNPLVNMTRANQQFSDRKLDAAYNSYKVAANNDDSSNGVKAEALTGASITLMNRGNLAYVVQAHAIAKQAVDADPNYSPALGQYGFTLFATGKNAESLDYLKKSIEANPRISKNYYYLGIIDRANNQYEDAINYLNQAIGAADNDNTIFTPQARSYNKAMYSLELAKTYAMAGSSPQIILSTVSQAINYDPRIKKRLSQDVEHTDVFGALEADPEFQNLVN